MTVAGSGPKVVVVGTPIGNLGDMSDRAREALASCDLLACEDTRRTGRLLELSGVGSKRLVRLDQHLERRDAPKLIERTIRESLVLGLVSDAGMPGLSDPGSVLISEAAQAGLDIEVVPGPFAGAVALVASGLLSGDSRFVFEGFLPRKTGERRKRLGELAKEQRLVVIYESPHRLAEMLADTTEVMGGDRRASVSRELTKMHEETLRGTVSELASHYAESPPKGEVVVVLEGAAPSPEPTEADLLEAYESYVNGGATPRDAATAVAEEFGVKVNVVKRLAFAQPR